MVQRLVHIERPIMCIPNLAIHLDRDSNEKFVCSKEDHLKPILATTVAEKLNEKSPTENEPQVSGRIFCGQFRIFL